MMGGHFINVILTKRSGHHAFIEWYRTHHPETSTFINNHPISSALCAKIASHIKTNQSNPLILNYEGVMPLSV